jgi:Ca2+-binding RTX toxin-like protein
MAYQISSANLLQGYAWPNTLADVSVATLANRIFYGWEYGTSSSNDEILARLVDGEGSALPSGSSPFQVNSTAGNEQKNPVVAAMTDGRFLVSWQSIDSPLNGYESNIRGQFVSLTGEKLGSEFLIRSASPGNHFQQTFLALADGRFLAAWSSFDSKNKFEVEARLFDADGSASGTEIRLSSSSSEFYNLDPDMAQLSGGKIAAAWRSYSVGDTQVNIMASVFDANGGAAKTFKVAVSEVNPDSVHPKVARLDGDRLLVVWVDDAGANGTDVFGRVYSKTGVAAGATFKINTMTQGNQQDPDLVTLPDGRVIIAWTSAENGGGTSIRTRVMDGDGKAIGTDFLATVSPSPFESSPLLSVMDGKKGLVSLLWQSRLTGTSLLTEQMNFNTYLGTAGIDRFYGYKSAEKFSGNDGDDVLGGGGGADLIDGGEGSDTATYLRDGSVKVSLVNPSSNAGAAKGDKFVSIENIEGSNNGDDRLGGDAKANEIRGNGGNDVLLGLGGNDDLDGGKGDDVLNGGAGADALVGGTGSDTASYLTDTAVTASLDDFGLGRGAALDDTYFSIENLEGSRSGNDRLFGDFRNNHLSGDGGADNLSGGAGADTLVGGRGADILDGQSGSDRYYYEKRDQGGDQIVKFEASDFFVFEGSAFGKLPTGTLDKSVFASGTSNQANDANDRFVFNTTDDTLWFDSNGNGSGGLVKIADLQNNFAVLAADILIV